MTVAVDNWENEDKLNRKESADFLSAYLTKRYALASKRSHADTFVLNIRAEWGFGKTFFLQRWAKDLGVNYLGFVGGARVLGALPAGMGSRNKSVRMACL